MTGSRAHVARIDVDLQRHATPPLAALRADIRAMLADEAVECAEDVELLATELVTNAYDHGFRPLYARLWTPDAGKLVRLEVADSDPVNLPVLGLSRFGAERGRGLVLVDQLAQRWGSAVRSWGKTIWAEVACGPSIA
ncbi:ATP-binding protein [Umezawaea sp.]|uniref:ATP-binding protein n=1 Tax=Umezawaea sp. TaxID=1955258 RepID=UPI002ED68E60